MESNRDTEIEELRAALQRERQARLDAEERHRRLFRALPVVALRLDGEGHILDMSDRWVEVLGLAREEVLGRRPSELMTEASRQRMFDAILPELTRTGRLNDEEVEFITKSGEVLDMLVSASGELDERGHQKDRFIAGQLDISSCVPRFDGSAFVAT